MAATKICNISIKTECSLVKVSETRQTGDIRLESTCRLVLCKITREESKVQEQLWEPTKNASKAVVYREMSKNYNEF